MPHWKPWWSFLTLLLQFCACFGAGGVISGPAGALSLRCRAFFAGQGHWRCGFELFGSKIHCRLRCRVCSPTALVFFCVLPAVFCAFFSALGMGLSLVASRGGRFRANFSVVVVVPLRDRALSLRSRWCSCCFLVFHPVIHGFCALLLPSLFHLDVIWSVLLGIKIADVGKTSTQLRLV